MGIAWLWGQQRKSSMLGSVHTSHCHLRAPWAGLPLLGCSQDPELGHRVVVGSKHVSLKHQGERI